MAVKFCLFVLFATFVMCFLAFVQKKLSNTFQIRACWLVGSATFSLGMFAYGNLIVIMTALIIPMFFELLHPTR